MAEKPVTVKNTASQAKDIGVVLLALAAGKLTADQAVQRLHPMYGPLAGSIIMIILALKTKSERVKWALAIIGAVHAGAFIKSATEGKTGIFSMINSYTPSLSGMRGLGVYQNMRGLGNAGLMLGNAPAEDTGYMLGNAPAQDEASMLLTGNFAMN